MTRTTRSSVSSEGDINASTTALNPEVGSPGEASGSQVSTQGGSDPQGVKGNVAQGFRNSGKYHFPKDLPKFEGGVSAWDKFDSELTYIVFDLTDIDLSLTEKPVIDTKTNEFIFQCISRCVGPALYDILCRFRGQ